MSFQRGRRVETSDPVPARTIHGLLPLEDAMRAASGLPGRMRRGLGSRWSLPNRPRRRAPEGGDESFSLGGGPSQMRRSVIRRDGEKPDLRAEWRRLGYAAVFFAACVLVVVLLSVVGLYH